MVDRESPSVPPQPWFDPKTGNATEPFRRFILSERGYARNVNSGVAAARAAAEAAASSAAQAQGTANGAVAGVANLAGQALSFSASYAPSSAYGSDTAPAFITTNTVTVTPVGGTAPYTYAWTITGANISINSPTAATTAFTSVSQVGVDVFLSQNATCTVTDSLLATTQCVVGVAMYGEPDVIV